MNSPEIFSLMFFSGIFVFLIFLTLLKLIFNWVNGIDANYMFICKSPDVESSFFIGEWPFYIFWLAIIYFVYVLILYLPFRLLEYINFNK